jgi:hypothetical protein
VNIETDVISDHGWREQLGIKQVDRSSYQETQGATIANLTSVARHHGRLENRGTYTTCKPGNLNIEVQYVTCPHGTMRPRSIRYQFRLGPNMVDEALAPSSSVEIADRLAMVPGLLS